MKTIKFNAIYQEKYYYWHYEPDRKNILKFILNPEIYVGVQLFQFSGLEDNADREIFEGDVVKFSVPLTGDFEGKIVFQSGMFMIVCDKIDDGYVPLSEYSNSEFWCEDVKVVGHISEGKGKTK